MSVLLPTLGKPEQSHVRHHLELEAQRAPLPRLPGLGAPRSAIDGRREVLVASTAVASCGDHESISGSRELAQSLLAVGVEDDGAERDPHLGVPSRVAVAVLALTVFAALGAHRAQVTHVLQRAQSRIGDQDYVSAVAAVAPCGPAERYELLPAERDDAVAAVAGLDLDRALVDEPHGGTG